MSVNFVPRLLPVGVARVPPCTRPLLGWTEVMSGGGHWSEDVKNMFSLLHSSMTLHSLEHQPHWNPEALWPRHEEQPVASCLQSYKIPAAHNIHRHLVMRVNEFTFQSRMSSHFSHVARWLLICNHSIKTIVDLINLKRNVLPLLSGLPFGKFSSSTI